MNELKVGDRVKVIFAPEPNKTIDVGVMVGMTGTVKELNEPYAGVEFDNYMGGHCGAWNGKNGYCWYIPYERLEKVEDTEEETKEETKEEIKTETMEQKILEVLREEIGVEIGEKFDVYENGVKRWTCKFEENGHLTRYKKCKFSESFIWKYWIFHFDKYVFKKKPFMPQNGEEYFCLYIKPTSSGVKYLDAGVAVWNGISFDYGMLALGNVFRTREEAIKSEDKLLERLNELLKEE